jgi:hypothetical protein
LTIGRLDRLDAAQLAVAQGIAANTAAGVRVFLEEGAWSTRLHAKSGARPSASRCGASAIEDAR